QQNDESYREINEPTQHRRNRHDQTRKVDFSNQVLIADQTIARGSQRVRKDLPRKQRAKSKHRIGNAVGRHACEPSKEHTENDHHEQRLNDGPRRAQSGLLVVHFEVAPSEEIKQLAIVPEFAQFNPGPRARWCDSKRSRLSRLLDRATLPSRNTSARNSSGNSSSRGIGGSRYSTRRQTPSSRRRSTTASIGARYGASSYRHAPPATRHRPSLRSEHRP